MQGEKSAIFLDRDGTINVDKGYLYRREDFEYLNGAVEAMQCLCKMGFMLIIVTNQSGIARGFYTEKQFRELDAWMREDLRKKGVSICGTYYCPHWLEKTPEGYRENCTCRKPKTGLFWKAREELGIDMGRSYAVGDKMRDLVICRESEVQGFLLHEDSTQGVSLREQNITVCRNWNEILQCIRNCGKTKGRAKRIG